ncbi:MAG: hypothetical protein CL912_27085 [Deltaproteobacteria bacterium]|nr:hypothetical protein [Deltaproteobacteria bacterium]|tara:strand:+ start:579 stop:857 length:279 start_codon:yes stop_codon:yes gene_type:complete
MLWKRLMSKFVDLQRLLSCAQNDKKVNKSLGCLAGRVCVVWSEVSTKQKAWNFESKYRTRRSMFEVLLLVLLQVRQQAQISSQATKRHQQWR